MKVREVVEDSIWLPGDCYQSQQVPEITIILPTYRRGKSGFFRRCVESVLKQNLIGFELIIVDDGSSDGTFDQIKKFMEFDGRISCIRHTKNVGVPAISTFEAFQRARSDLIGFAFDDNEFFPEAFENLLLEMKRLDADMVYGSVEMHVDDPVVGSYVVPLGSDPVPLSTLESHNFIPNNAVLVHRRVFEGVGWYDPHIIITRLCDWDLWRRVRKVFRICRVNVRVGIELGPALTDSLGATHKMDLLAIEEWVKADGRNDKLLPANFLNYDFVNPTTSSSIRIQSSLEEIQWQFRGKDWGRGLGNEIDRTKVILVVVPTLDASVSLYFERICKELEQHLRILEMASWRPDQVLGASAVIIVRDLFAALSNGWVELCRLHGIDHYYFTDDNFFELAEVDSAFDKWSINEVAPLLVSFGGVLLSTNSLVEYFRKNELHHNVMLFPPMMHSFSITEKKRKEHRHEELRVAFLGGNFRLKALRELVLPCLVKLSSTHKIHIFVVGGDNELLKFAGPRLRVTLVERDLDYFGLISYMASLSIDVVVHPTDSNPNNAFKSTNMLLNSTILGCPLVVSNQDPYREQLANKAWLSAENTVDGWKFELERLFNDFGLRNDVIRHAADHCRSRYSGAQNRDVLQDILQRSSPVGPIVTQERLRGCLRATEIAKSRMSNKKRLKLLLKEILRGRIYRLVGGNRWLFMIYVKLRHFRFIKGLQKKLAT